MSVEKCSVWQTAFVCIFYLPKAKSSIHKPPWNRLYDRPVSLAIFIVAPLLFKGFSMHVWKQCPVSCTWFMVGDWLPSAKNSLKMANYRWHSGGWLPCWTRVCATHSRREIFIAFHSGDIYNQPGYGGNLSLSIFLFLRMKNEATEPFSLMAQKLGV